ncbi:hypothetical protein AX17_003353 [Amanita inopinata Kibby_2008]|nr:hypothetical protein AX17_003353 [Amanita inopinata Kibby_2008]
MLRALIARRPPLPQRRSLVSTVLLNRAWEDASLSDLRKEAKARGLSSKGNKATVTARIQQHDGGGANASNATQHRNHPSITPARYASTEATLSEVQFSVPEIVPAPAGEAGVAPGIPPHPNKTNSDRTMWNITLPDLTQPDPLEPVQIPYVPDFWQSSTQLKKAPEEEEPSPKLLVVADASAHHAGGPTHNLVEDTVLVETVQPWAENVKGSQSGGLLSDIADDLGLGPLTEIKRNWRKFLS